LQELLFSFGALCASVGEEERGAALKGHPNNSPCELCCRDASVGMQQTSKLDPDRVNQPEMPSFESDLCKEFQTPGIL